ncbi:MAG: chorismate synthase [Deltaproteobacteria bacterium]|jgi:chorismate synthase|nr:chorismate synthase [Deltaproteobacteria bacterium]
MKIVISGPKHAGKISVAKMLSTKLGLLAIETDTLIEDAFATQQDHQHTCREIFLEHGEEAFRAVEEEVASKLADVDWKIIVCGGSSLLSPTSRRALRKNAILIYLKAETEVLWSRMLHDGLPPWLSGPHAKQKLEENVAYRDELLAPFADIIIETSDRSPEQIAQTAIDSIIQEIAIRSRAANTYGDIIRVTTFGESHGPSIGCVLDGVKPGIDFPYDAIQTELTRRRPGQSDVTTPRDEKYKLNVLSGVFEGKTTGAPIAMAIFNKDQNPSNYEGIKDLFRPGHADFTYYKKYGIRDHRGGGRSSGRETAGRVMSGAVVRGLLADKGVKIIAHSVEIAGICAETCDYEVIEKNDVRCADAKAAEKMKAAVINAKDDNDSVGGIVKLEIFGVPAGLGDPVFAKLHAQLTHAIMTIGAIKGIEIGRGFELPRLRGSESNDQMADGGFLSNNAGGITGGISTGQPIYLRIAVKPTSSIAQLQKTIDPDGKTHNIETHGRHDPCIVPRVIPVIENMTALVIYEAWAIQSRLNPDWEHAL